MKKVVITLVNGTFAEDAPWIQPDSTMAQRLRNELPLGGLPEKCPWDGHNTVKARILAADKLRTHVKNIAERPQDAGEMIHHFVITHSHGGNVAMLACKDKATEQSLAGVITLATPFLYFRESRAAALLSGFGLTVFISLFFFGVLGCMKLLGLEETLWYNDWFQLVYWTLFFAILIFFWNAHMEVQAGRTRRG